MILKNCSFVWLATLIVGLLYVQTSPTMAQGAGGSCARGLEAVAAQDEDPNVYVLDTNIFYADPGLLDRMADKQLILPRSVIEELDRHKAEFTDRGQTSRTISSQIRRLMKENRGKQKIELSRGGVLYITEVTNDYRFPSGLDSTKVDDRIVALARQIQDTNPHKNVIVLSGDNNVANLAFSVGLDSDEVTTSVDPAAVKEMLEGPIVVKVSAEDLAHVRASSGLTLEDAQHLGLDEKIQPHENQYIIFELDSEESSGFDLKSAMSSVWRFHHSSKQGDNFYPVAQKAILEMAILPRNVEQIIAADLLINSHIKVVTLAGLAGTGKTLLTLAAGLAHSTLFAGDGEYDKVILTRPNQVVGADMGFLPGDIKEKMAPFMGPFRDNLAVIVEEMRKSPGRFRGRYEAAMKKKRSGQEGLDLDTGVRAPSNGNGNGNGNGSSKALTFDDIIGEKLSVKEVVNRLMESDLVSVEAIAYSRGRTWNNTLLIIDEAQNLTMHEVRTLLTRVGKGTKVVLLGDIQQIDNKLLNHTNNGLIIAASRMRGLHFVGHMNLTIGERSEVASEAAKRLQPK